MRFTSYLTCFAFLAVTAIGAWNDFTDLHPVLAPRYDVNKYANMVPLKNVSLYYTFGNSMDPLNSVNIDLLTKQPVMLLESIGSVHAVTCTSNTVTVTFNSTTAFERALGIWPIYDIFYLVTNSAEGCDAKGERGIYEVESLIWQDDIATVTARTIKKNLVAVTDSMHVTFSHVRGSIQNSSGNITFDEPGINVASNFSLPPDMEIFEAPQFTTIAKDGYLTDAAIIRGYFSYDVPSARLQSLWFDIDAAFIGDLSVTFNLTAPLDNNNFLFSPGQFFPSAISVPNAFSLKPALRWAVGADVGAVGAIYHNSNITTEINDGHAHIDFMDANKSYAVGWSPRLASAVETAEAATGHASPFIDFTIELALDVMDGLYNTTGGITARPQFVNELNVAQSQTRVRKASRMIWPRNVTCTNGFELRSAFNFSVNAYVEGSWEKTLYNTTVPIADECYRF
ncbi:hypothetical protein F4813DRAFT_396885 [Daldinia decipiens]|uniref:uncharacterized protein n=1 Tax=Daldinia decipiens TaxID=326647 RepID=UPI0020C4927C|nr:uncharacterized protein F4813DRAFT_396885 [Daldinia decipiens]KAI1662180.1 hypothetical protein F4813DRAFT_396885 [Daldinia decipiens]